MSLEELGRAPIKAFEPNKCNVVTNGERAEGGSRAIEMHLMVTGGDYEDVESSIVALITDLFHFCDKENYNVSEIVQRAANHWLAER